MGEIEYSYFQTFVSFGMNKVYIFPRVSPGYCAQAENLQFSRGENCIFEYLYIIFSKLL